MTLPKSALDLPPYPPSVVVETGVREYLGRADRMTWCPYEAVSAARLSAPGIVTDAQISAIRTALIVEDHLPSYLAEYIRALGNPEVSCLQAAVNRHVLRFVFRWAAEEDRHSHALELYLTETGLLSQADLDAEAAKARQVPYRFQYERLAESFVYLALQERATHLYYCALAEAVDEPVLRAVLRRMAADEARHAQFFYDMLIRSHADDFTILAARVTEVAREFRMPLQSSLDGYRLHVLNLFRAAPRYRHEAALSHLSRAIERAARGDQMAVQDLAIPRETTS